MYSRPTLGTISNGQPCKMLLQHQARHAVQPLLMQSLKRPTMLNSMDAYDSVLQADAIPILHAAYVEKLKKATLSTHIFNNLRNYRLIFVTKPLIGLSDDSRLYEIRYSSTITWRLGSTVLTYIGASPDEGSCRSRACGSGLS